MQNLKKLNFKNINPELCNKCGTCVGICPVEALNTNNEEILFDNDKCISCSQCYNNCPGIEFNYPQMNKLVFGDNSIVNKKIGCYSSLYLVQSKQLGTRNGASSGGAITTILSKAFKKKLIDGAIVVSMSESKPWMCTATIVDNLSDINHAKGSKYTLISLNSILKKTRQFKKIAFVGLPCHIHGIRKLQKNKHKNVSNIKYILGLFCGFNVSNNATKFLIRKQGIKFKDILSIEYRGGKWPGGFLIKTKNPKISKTHFLPKYYYDIVDTMFVPKRCLICIDYMAEFSDISFGDIWLDELNREPWGTMIIRTERGKTLLELVKNSINLKQLPLEKLINSHEHNIKHKKIGAFMRMDEYNQKPIYGISPLKHTNAEGRRIKLESFIFKIATSKTFHMFAELIPLSIMGLAAKLRRKLLKKTI